MSPRRAILTGSAFALGILCLGIGYGLGTAKGSRVAPFHDLRVIHLAEYTSLVDPRDESVRELARRMGTPERAYLFVRDRIAFDPTLPAAPPGETLRDGAGSCLGKAALLCSLYRAMGAEPEEVRVMTGEVAVGGMPASHAWIDLEFQGRCLQQDPTSLLGVFGFGEFPGAEYTHAFVQGESFCFNDRGLAVISQLNRFRGGSPPGMPPLPPGE